MQLNKFTRHTLKVGKRLFTRNTKVGISKHDCRKPSFMNALRPILFPLSMVGIQPLIDSETTLLPRKRSLIRWWNILALIYLHVFSVKAVAAIVMTSGGLDFWIQLTTFLRSSAATISADIYVYKQAKLEAFFRRISHVFESLNYSECKGFQRRIRMGAAIVWLFLVSYFVASMVTVYNMGIDNFLNAHLFGLRIPSMSPVTLFALGCFMILIRQLIMWGTVSFMVVLYIALCDAIKLSFKSYIRNLVKAFTRDGMVLDADALLKLRRHYDYLTDLIARMDDIFSSAVFLWYSSFILSVCIDITFDVTLYSNEADFPLLVSILKLALLFTAYVVIGLSASLATEECQKCVPMFFRLAALDGHSPQLSPSLQMFGLHLQSFHPALTGWGFFTLNRSYMMTVVGILVSYVIIVVQLNPRFMKNIITG